MKKNKKILLVGGGSGGHILPVVSIVEQLKKDFPEIDLIFCCDNLNYGISKKSFEGLDIKIKPIIAGKFRRYNHLKWYYHFLYLSIFIPNIIDGFKVLLAHIQVFFLVLKMKPDVIFAKGGYPCLPFGIISKITKTKLIIHDSDTVAGLTNKVLSKYANKILTGMPVKYYNYPKNKTIFVGMPIKKTNKMSIAQKEKIKEKLSFEKNKKTILLTGGGLGSNFINNLAIELSEKSKDYNYVLLSGKRDFQRVIKKESKNLKIFDFVNNFDQYLIISDLIISRAGATTIAEICNAKKPAILIPSYKMTGNHQVKNASVMSDSRAMIVIDERNCSAKHILKEIDNVIDNKELINNLNNFSGNKASQKISKIIGDI